MVFKLDQTLSHERVLCSLAIKPNSQKKVEYIHTILKSNQTLSLVIKQNGTHVRKTRMEQHWMFKFQTLDDKCVNYWSSVKAVKVMKGLASFNISISELILKYIFSVKMSVHLFTKEKVFKSASWNHLDFTFCSIIGPNSKHFPSESGTCQISLGGSKVQVTGHRSGYRSGYRPQVTGYRPQATGQITGHTKKQWDTGQNCSGLRFYHTKIK